MSVTIKEELLEGVASEECSFDITVKEEPLDVALEESLSYLKKEKDIVVKEEPFNDSKGNYRKDYWSESKKESDVVIAGEYDILSGEDEEKYFRKLQDSRFPIVLIQQLNISVQEQYKIPSSEKRHQLISKCANNSTQMRQSESSSKCRNVFLVKEKNISCEPMNKKQFSCSKFKRVESYKCRMLTYLKQKEYQCPKCRYKFELKSDLNRHLLIHSEVKLFKCFLCKYESHRKDCLKIHMLNHSEIKLFQPNYENNQNWSFITPKFIHYEQKLLKCYDCNYEFIRKSDFNAHMVTHSRVKLLKCTECSYKSIFEERFKEHMLTHTGFKCSECNSEFLQERDLKTHMLFHYQTKLFKCSECNYETSRMVNLRIHRLTHSRVKFKCSQCNAEFFRKGSLKMHMSTHAEINLFKCSQCSYETFHKKYLKLHMSTIHSGKEKRKKTLTTNLPIKKRNKWSVKEKKEILWCGFYARNDRFPKMKTNLRNRKIMHQRGIISVEKIEATSDNSFANLFMSLKCNKSLKPEIKMQIGKEVENFLISSPPKESKTWEWNLERNLYLMESYYMGGMISSKTNKSEVLKLALERKEFNKTDFYVYRMQKKYQEANLSKKEIVMHKNNIIFALKERRDSILIPSHKEVKEVEQSAKIKIEQMTFSLEIIEEIIKQVQNAGWSVSQRRTTPKGSKSKTPTPRPTMSSDEHSALMPSPSQPSPQLSSPLPPPSLPYMSATEENLKQIR